MGQLQDKVRSFWDRPEGTTGMIFAVLGMVAGGFLLFHALPLIITLLTNAIIATGLAVGLGLILFVLSDKRFRTLLGYMYKSVMRKITQIFVEIDPIGILKGYVAEIEENLRKMDGQIGKLRGQLEQLKAVIARNDREKANALKTMQVAKQQGQERSAAFVLKSRQAGRLQDSNMTLTQLLTRLEALYRVLLKMREVAQFTAEDIKSEVDTKTREYNAVNAASSAFRSAMEIIRGGTASRELFNQAMEHLAENYGNKVGEIRDFIETSQGFIQSVDLQQGVFEEDALAMLDQWEKRSDSFIFGTGEKELLLAGGVVDAQVMNATSARPQLVSTDSTNPKQLPGDSALDDLLR